MRHRTEAFHEALRNDLAHAREWNTRAFACLNRRRRLRFSFCATTVGEHGYRFRGSAHVGFGDTTVRAFTFHVGKINAEFGCDATRDRRRFNTRFFWLFSLGGRRGACLYSFLLLRRSSFFVFRFRRRRLFRFNLGPLFFLLCRFRPFFFFLFRRFLLWRSLAFAPYERNSFADVYLSAFLDINFCQRPILRLFPFHCRFILLNLGEHFAG